MFVLDIIDCRGMNKTTHKSPRHDDAGKYSSFKRKSKNSINFPFSLYFAIGNNELNRMHNFLFRSMVPFVGAAAAAILYYNFFANAQLQQTCVY